jgi:NhaP-type Na+/H+ and K+/H+ antiporter
MENQASAIDPPQSLGLHKTLFIAFLTFALLELCAIEKAAFHRGGGLGVAFEVGLPWVVILGFGTKIWRAAKRNEVDARSAGADLMSLGLLAFLAYNAMKDVSRFIG